MENEIDLDPQETQEWVESLESVLEHEGADRAHYLLEKLSTKRGVRVLTCPIPLIPLT